MVVPHGHLRQLRNDGERQATAVVPDLPARSASRPGARSIFSSRSWFGSAWRKIPPSVRPTWTKFVDALRCAGSQQHVPSPGQFDRRVDPQAESSVVVLADPEAIVSPGGVGFDINCGVRLVRTSLDESDMAPLKEQIAQSLFNHIPVGVGSKVRNRETVVERREGEGE